VTDLASALADNSQLKPFEGADVLRTQVAVTNAGDGLSQALAIQPQALALGTTAYVVLECRVQQIKHVPAVDKDHPEEGLTRIHVLRAGRATLVDRESVLKALDDQAERIRIAQEEAQGIQRLETHTDDWDEQDRSGEEPYDPSDDVAGIRQRVRKTRTS
jgi:hypothetical protein